MHYVLLTLSILETIKLSEVETQRYHNLVIEFLDDIDFVQDFPKKLSESYRFLSIYLNNITQKFNISQDLSNFNFKQDLSPICEDFGEKIDGWLIYLDHLCNEAARMMNITLTNGVDNKTNDDQRCLFEKLTRIVEVIFSKTNKFKNILVELIEKDKICEFDVGIDQLKNSIVELEFLCQDLIDTFSFEKNATLENLVKTNIETVENNCNMTGTQKYFLNFIFLCLDEIFGKVEIDTEMGYISTLFIQKNKGIYGFYLDVRAFIADNEFYSTKSDKIHSFETAETVSSSEVSPERIQNLRKRYVDELEGFKTKVLKLFSNRKDLGKTYDIIYKDSMDFCLQTLEEGCNLLKSGKKSHSSKQMSIEIAEETFNKVQKLILNKLKSCIDRFHVNLSQDISNVTKESRKERQVGIEEGFLSELLSQIFSLRSIFFLESEGYFNTIFSEAANINILNYKISKALRLAIQTDIEDFLSKIEIYAVFTTQIPDELNSFLCKTIKSHARSLLEILSLKNFENFANSAENISQLQFLCEKLVKQSSFLVHLHDRESDCLSIRNDNMKLENTAQGSKFLELERNLQDFLPMIFASYRSFLDKFEEKFKMREKSYETGLTEPETNYKLQDFAEFEEELYNFCKSIQFFQVLSMIDLENMDIDLSRAQRELDESIVEFLNKIDRNVRIQLHKKFLKKNAHSSKKHRYYKSQKIRMPILESISEVEEVSDHTDSEISYFCDSEEHLQDLAWPEYDKNGIQVLLHEDLISEKSSVNENKDDDVDDLKYQLTNIDDSRYSAVGNSTLEPNDRVFYTHEQIGNNDCFSTVLKEDFSSPEISQRLITPSVYHGKTILPVSDQHTDEICEKKIHIGDNNTVQEVCSTVTEIQTQYDQSNPSDFDLDRSLHENYEDEQGTYYKKTSTSSIQEAKLIESDEFHDLVSHSNEDAELSADFEFYDESDIDSALQEIFTQTHRGENTKSEENMVCVDDNESQSAVSDHFPSSFNKNEHVSDSNNDFGEFEEKNIEGLENVQKSLTKISCSTEYSFSPNSEDQDRIKKYPLLDEQKFDIGLVDTPDATDFETDDQIDYDHENPVFYFAECFYETNSNVLDSKSLKFEFQDATKIAQTETEPAFNNNDYPFEEDYTDKKDAGNTSDTETNSKFSHPIDLQQEFSQLHIISGSDSDTAKKSNIESEETGFQSDVFVKEETTDDAFPFLKNDGCQDDFTTENNLTEKEVALEAVRKLVDEKKQKNVSSNESIELNDMLDEFCNKKHASSDLHGSNHMPFDGLEVECASLALNEEVVLEIGRLIDRVQSNLSFKNCLLSESEHFNRSLAQKHEKTQATAKHPLQNSENPQNNADIHPTINDKMTEAEIPENNDQFIQEKQKTETNVDNSQMDPENRDVLYSGTSEISDFVSQKIFEENGELPEILIDQENMTMPTLQQVQEKGEGKNPTRGVLCALKNKSDKGLDELCEDKHKDIVLMNNLIDQIPSESDITALATKYNGDEPDKMTQLQKNLHNTDQHKLLGASAISDHEKNSQFRVNHEAKLADVQLTKNFNIDQNQISNSIKHTPNSPTTIVKPSDETDIKQSEITRNSDKSAFVGKISKTDKNKQTASPNKDQSNTYSTKADVESIKTTSMPLTDSSIQPISNQASAADNSSSCEMPNLVSSDRVQVAQHRDQNIKNDSKCGQGSKKHNGIGTIALWLSALFAALLIGFFIFKKYPILANFR